MKKLFFVMAAVAALLTSCSKDDTFGGPTRGKVTFEVSTPELATRYGEGTTATALQYAVYDMIEDATNGKLVDTGTATLSDKNATVSIDLVEGRKYTAIFWADAGENASPYTFTPATKTVSYTNVNNLTANNEAYDAFFAYVPEDQVKVGETVNVTLKRPFAQLNIATSDKVRAEALEVIVEQTAVEVQAYTTLNLVNGTVSGKQALKFALAEAPDNFDINVPVDNTTNPYDVLSTNYLLVNASENVDVTFTFTDMVGNEEKSYVRQYSSIPVQRNYRTNVIGSILTDNTNFNVTIDQDFEDPDKNENVDNNNANNNTFGVATAAELQAALDAATDGATIYFTDDITDGVTATQKPDVKITILGQGRSLKGAITVDGKSNAYPTAGLTIKDVVFNAQTISTEACINLGVDGNSNTRYINNLTVEGCTFDVPDAVGVKSYDGGDKNLTIIGCTATDKAHSLLQVNNVGESLIIKDCVANSKNGINLNQTPKVDIDNFTANVKGYAVRFGASSGGTGAAETYLIKNSSLRTDNSESDAVIILRATADNSTLTIENTTINGDKRIENNATNATIIINGVATVSSTEALAAVLNKGITDINLTKGTYSLPAAIQGKTVTIVGNEETIIKVNKDGTDSQNTSNATIHFEGVKIEGAMDNYRGFPHTKEVSFKNCTIENLVFLHSKATFEGCTFESTAEHCVWTYGAKDVTFTDCTFKYGDRCVNVYVDNGTESVKVDFTNCTFDNTDDDTKGAVEINSSVFPMGANVSLTNCTAPSKGDMVYISEWDSTAGATATVTVNGETYNAPVHQSN